MNSKNTILAVILLACGSLYAQRNALTTFIKEKKATNFFTYKENNPLTAEGLVTHHKNELGLSENDALISLKSETDQLGFTHFKYQQQYKGIEVYGAQYLIHEKNGKVVSSNGNLVKAINFTNTPSVAAQVAIQNAIKFVGAKEYIWENPLEEQLLKQLKKDANATYFPFAELVYFDKFFTQVGSNYRLAYKIEVYAKKPLSKQDVFVDAQTGKVLHTINKIHTTEVSGVAQTKYSGTQSIQVDSLTATSYRLREYARGGGIETYNMLQGTNYGAAVDFTDTDNIWNNINPQQDEAATDAHWAAEMTYDYFFNNHGRDSYDNLGSTLFSYVHYDVNYANAFWDGVRMTYGDGDGTNFTALTSLDVGGHEITHGVTEYAANLVYQNEPGALNESFSDIFGTAVEFYANPINADWFIGEDFDINGNGFRSMSDPNSVGDPDTYLGVNWEFTAVDNGGVHTNSSVQNYWFYLLSVGGSGINDNNDSYNVTGLGLDSAAAIAYRNLTVYLTQSSQYWDAREGALQAAADLYGTCSNAVIETSKAWAAVGVGFPIQDYDLALINIESPATACNLSNAEDVVIQIRNNGCSVNLLAGDNIPVAFQIDGGAIINEIVTLTTNLNGGDTLTYTFTATADLSIVGVHTINAWIDYNLDPQASNDSILNMQVEHKIQQNVDVALVDVISPTEGCYLTNAESVNVAIQFFGCDSLPSGTNVDVEYQLNGGSVVNETILLPVTLFPQDTLYYTFTTTVDLSANGTHLLDVWTAYSLDNMNTNDTLSGTSIKHPYPLSNTDTLTFESNAAALDSVILTQNIESNASISNASASTGNYALRLTGGDPLNSSIIPDLDTANFWSRNLEFAAFAKFCVDASSWSDVYMQFDLRQTMSMVYNLQFGQPIPQASSLRIVVNGNQVSGTYNPTTEKNDPFVTKALNLSAYAGSQLEIIFESRMGFRQSADPLAILGSEGDNAYVDNILFTQLPIGIKENKVIENVDVYPNPTKGNVSIEFLSASNQKTNVTIIDVLGNVVRIDSYQIQQGKNILKIDISNQANGIYFVKIVSKEGNYTARIIKN